MKTHPALSSLLALIFTLSSTLLTAPGCASAGKNSRAKSLKPLPFETETKPRSANLLDTSPIVVDDQQEEQRKAELDRMVNLPVRSSNQPDAVPQASFPDNLIRGVKNPEAVVDVHLAFNAAELAEVVAAFAAPTLLNFSYLIDPSVKGAVTLNVDAKMPATKVWETFEHILWLSGAYASKNPGFIHILPFAKMPQERRIYAEHDVQPNVVVDFITVKYKKSSDVVTQLKPFMTDGASITDVPDTNTVVIVEAPANINKLRELVKHIDSKGEREWPCKTFQIREVEADVLGEELTQLLPVLGFPVATGTGTSGGAIKIMSLPRVGCIVVSAALPEVVDEVGKWVKALDRSDMLDKEEIYFFNVTHTTVEKLTSAMQAFFNAEITSNNSTLGSGSSSSTSSSSTKSSSSSSSSSTKKSTTSTKNSNRTSSSTKKNNTEEKLTTSIFETEVIVFADQESNRLTIKTTPRTWGLLEAFLKRHDIPSRQVSIKAIIADIALDKSTEFGVSYAASKLFSDGKWTGSGGYAGAGVLSSVFQSTDGITQATGAWSSSGLGLIIHKAGDPLALVRAVAGEGKTNILSEPQLVVVSGSEAKLQAGEQIAVPTQTTNYTTSSGNTSTNYEYKDIGVIMTVTPYITAGNEVRLTIEQEVSAVSASSTTSNSTTTAPNFTTKKISTEMTVKDNSTIMMGGMIKNNEISTKTGIPLLRDIPALGWLFGYTSIQKTRTELLVLITVNVVDTENFQDELVRKYKQSLEEIEKHKGEKYE